MKRQKKHKYLRAGKRYPKVLLTILLVLVLLAGLVAGYVWSKLRLIDYDDGTLKSPGHPEEMNMTEGSDDIQMPEETMDEYILDYSGLEEMETLPPIPDREVQKRDDVINILVLGTDSYDGTLTKYARSDAMILVSINKTDNTVKLVSLERGMGVYMESGEKAGEWDLLTHAFRWGGAKLVCDCVEQHLRVEVDHYVRVTFDTVTTVVNAIGGINVELDEAEAAYLSTCFRIRGKTQFSNLKAGRNYLDGEAALAFARLREIDSDWQRVGRQRRVILAAVEALKSASLKQLNNLVDTTLPLIQTDMSMLEIADLMLYAPNFLQSEFDQMTIPKQGTYGYKNGITGFAVDYEENSRILEDFLYGERE